MAALFLYRKLPKEAPTDPLLIASPHVDASDDEMQVCAAQPRQNYIHLVLQPLLDFCPAA
jgi:hypothetical protein